MLKLTALLLFAFLWLNAFSQPVAKIARYAIPVAGEAETQLVFTMPFGKADITQITGDTSRLRDAGDMMIDVVCTEYPSNLSLTELNRQRLANFLAMFPYIHKSQIIAVTIYRQLHGSEKQVADTMFHGLVLKYRPRQNAETMRHDVAKLEQMLQPAPSAIPVATRPTTPPPVAVQDTVSKKTAPENTYRQYSNLHAKRPGGQWLQMAITPDASTATANKNIAFGGISVFILKSSLKVDSPITVTPRAALEQKIISPAQFNMFKNCSKIVIVVTKPPPATPGVATVEKEAVPELRTSGADTSHAVKTPFTPKYPMPDSTLFKILLRNHWQNTVVVGDVTGSMYPYTGQLLLWLKINSLDSLGTQYVFFNDGDNLPDDKKHVGATGGIYSADCNTVDEVLALVKETMMKGDGGDNPENDVEALLEAEKAFPGGGYTVLIGDNWAPIRDLQLAHKLSKPVKIVLFGTEPGRVNADYLNLARKTNGSVHLINEDITNLAAFREGQVLKIGVYSYKVVNGQFVDNK